MKSLILIVALLTILNCEGQDSSKQFFFPQVGWTIIANPTKFADSSLFNSITRKANSAMNDTYGTDIDLAKEVHSLFTIIDGNYNLFGSTINLFDSSIFPTWELSYLASKQMILNVLENQSPALKILDTLSGYEIIDGLRFEKFYMKTFYPSQSLTMNTYWFYRKQNQYDFSINISFTDDEKGKLFLEILRKSRFIH